MRELLEGYSRALYSNWLWHRTLQCLVDAGEGVHLALRHNVWQLDVVAITHGHSDHVLGLPGLAGARRFGKGATSKPWVVLYPRGSAGVEAMRTAIGAVWPGVEFPITWIPIAHGESHPLGRQRAIEAFTVTHTPPHPALGYRVLETRRRLKPEHADLPPRDVERLARSLGRDAVMDEYRHVLFAHSGDAMPVEAALVANADVLVHDATFLGADERREPIHATTGEVLALACAAGVRVLVLNHLSVRYPRESAIPTIRDQVAASGFTGECWLLDESELIPVSRTT